MRQLLIVDDEPAICASLSFALEDSFKVCEAHDADEALEAIRRKEIDIVLLDLRLGSSDGIEVLKQMKQSNQKLVIIMMTAFGSIQSSVAAMKAGAFYYITKPLNMDELQMLLNKAVDHIKLESRVQYLNNKLYRSEYEVAGIIGKSAAMRQVMAQVEKLRGVDVNVLISGESGTGKELVAKALQLWRCAAERTLRGYQLRCDSAGSCLKVSCSAMRKELFRERRSVIKGLFEQADKGTLFLDEIGEMDQRSAGKAAAGGAGERNHAGGFWAAKKSERPHSLRDKPRSGQRW